MLYNNDRFFSFLMISLIALIFGYWFACNQINVISRDALMSYPMPYFLMTVFKCYLTIIAFFALAQFILSAVTLGKLKSFYIAISFAPLVLVYFNYSLLWIVSLMLGLQIFMLLLSLHAADYRRLTSCYLTDFAVLILFFLLHCFFTTRFSPLYWNVALLAGDGYYTEELPVLAPIFRGFILVKQFSFSYLDHAQWAAIMNPPTTLASPFMQLLTFIFDLPSINYEAFHVVLSAVYFTLLVMGSFGFYLFLKYAAKLSWPFAIFGGWLFCFSGAPFFSDMFSSDGGILLAPYVAFPYALLAISLAVERNNIFYSMWAGLALAAQFFFLTPHPEGVIYSLLFYGIYTIGLLYFSPQRAPNQKFLLATVSIGSFFLLSAYSLVPILYDKIMTNMYVFAHTGDIKHGRLEHMAFYFFLFIATWLVSRFVLGRKKSFSPVYSSSVALATFIIVMMGITWITTVARFLAHHAHVGLHFWYIFRPGMYFTLAVTVMFLFVLEALTIAFYQLIFRIP